MAGYFKSSDIGAHGQGGHVPPHPHHSSHGHAHAHAALPGMPGMPAMPSLPFGLTHGLDAVGFPQGMWGE